LAHVIALSQNAVITSYRCGGEIDRHTFDDALSRHVDNSKVVAMPKTAVPSFKVRLSFRIEGGGLSRSF